VLAVAAELIVDDFGVTYVDVDGVEERGLLDVLWSVPFERVLPVRGFSSFKGQRNFSGWWWLATTGEHVGFESWLERDQLMMLDFDRDVVAVSSQPFWLSWRDGARRRRHAPDYFARSADGSALVMDVRPDDRIPSEDAEAFAVTAAACELVGWRYLRVGAVDAVFAANVRWLAGYRHRRFGVGERAELLRGVFATPRPLAEGVAVAGDGLALLPVLFHLLWSGVLVTDAVVAPLGADSIICAAGVS